MAKCPECACILTPEQIRKLWAAYNGEKTSDAKKKSSIENLKKRKG